MDFRNPNRKTSEVQSLTLFIITKEKNPPYVVNLMQQCPEVTVLLIRKHIPWFSVFPFSKADEVRNSPEQKFAKTILLRLMDLLFGPRAMHNKLL